MNYPIRRVAFKQQDTLHFYGPAEPKTLPDKSNGLIRENDWVIEIDGGAYALTHENFPKANGILVIK